MESSDEKLIIRKEQMEAFREVAIKDFEDRTVALPMPVAGSLRAKPCAFWFRAQ